MSEPTGVDEQADDEGPPVAEAAHDPAAVGQGADEVGTEVGTLQAACLGGRDVESGLELGIENVQKAICRQVQVSAPGRH